MKEFDQICKEFETLDVLTYSAVLAAKSAEILPALTAVTGTAEDGASVFALFILGSIAADGKLSEEEYLVLYPLLHTFFGDELNYDDCRKAALALRPESRELKKCVNDMVDLLGQLSDELKSDIILVCLMICAVDGKVSLKEKRWIKQLIK